MAHAVALAAALGAWWMFAVSVPVLVVLVLLTSWRRHVALVVLLTFVAVGTRGAAAVDALDPPEADSFSGWVTLLDDPRPAVAHRLGVTLPLSALRRGS